MRLNLQTLLAFNRASGINHKLISSLLCAILLSCQHSKATDIAYLTGVKAFSANDLKGAANNRSWFDTVGGNWDFNLYLTEANTGIDGAFLNQGDGASASINIPLNLGTYSFWMYSVGVTDSNWGLNLYFDSDQTSPKITGISSLKTNSTDPAFFANPASSVPVLSSTTLTQSPKSLVYQTNGAYITLSSYFFAAPSVFQKNRVSAHDSIPDSSMNSVSFMTLTVSSVPEPSTYALGLIASGALAAIAKRRKSRKITIA